MKNENYNWFKQNDMTSIMISRDTRGLLLSLGRKKESYDSLIRRIITENCYADENQGAGVASRMPENDLQGRDY